MAANPKAHLLVNTMRAHMPAPANNPSMPEAYVVTVVNPGQVELLNQEKPRLLQSLRDAVGNDFLDFRIDVDENAAAPTAWSDRYVLNHMVERSPYLAQFITDFKFTLSCLPRRIAQGNGLRVPERRSAWRRRRVVPCV